jgi:hypothetical protein
MQLPSATVFTSPAQSLHIKYYNLVTKVKEGPALCCYRGLQDQVAPHCLQLIATCKLKPSLSFYEISSNVTRFKLDERSLLQHSVSCTLMQSIQSAERLNNSHLFT